MQRTTEDLLQHLGLERTGDPLRAPRFEDGATHGFRAAEVPATFAEATALQESQLDRLGPYTLEVGAPGLIDATAYPAAPGLVRLGLPGSDTMPAAYFAPSEGRRRSWPIEGRRGELVVDVRGGAVVVVTSGVSVVLEFVDGETVIQALADHAAARIVAPAAIVDEARAAGDAWLADALPAVVARGEGWGSAVAVGMFGRLLDETRARKSALLARILAGETDDRDMLMTRWASGLTARALQRLEDLAIAQASAIRADMEGLGDDASFGSDDWRASLQALCIARDELESVYTVLEGAGAGTRVLPVIAALDQSGRTFRDALPTQIEPSPTEQLARARRTAPDGWWTTGRRA